MGYQAATEVKVISPEILTILEADVLCMTEGSIHITISRHLQSWNISRELWDMTWQGDVSPTGSKTAAWYQMETMGTREAQGVLHCEVCDVKPMNGEALQMTLWESDQFIVPMKQGNACRGKGLTGARMTSGAHLPHPEVECR